ncbi:hypothetical protein C0992_005655, partial [Termitomyces sp. T32_za158]
FSVVKGAIRGAWKSREGIRDVLGAAGFTDAGPAANSFASYYQSSAGNISRGSPFAVAQSVAMGGHSLGVLVLGAVLGSITTVMAYYLSENQDDDNLLDSGDKATTK